VLDFHHGLLGQGVAQDYIEAYRGLFLAALPPGELRDKAAQSRDRVATQLTPAQVAEAQKRVQAWLKARRAPSQ
jgi:hypothetical protein